MKIVIYGHFLQSMSEKASEWCTENGLALKDVFVAFDTQSDTQSREIYITPRDWFGEREYTGPAPVTIVIEEESNG